MKSKILFTLVLATSLAPVALRAEEGGSGHYSPGASASFINALPGYPSIAVVNYFTYYDGSVGGDRTLALGGNLATDVKASVYVNTVGEIYETPLRLLGGDYAAGLVSLLGR